MYQEDVFSLLVLLDGTAPVLAKPAAGLCQPLLFRNPTQPPCFVFQTWLRNLEDNVKVQNAALVVILLSCRGLQQ